MLKKRLIFNLLMDEGYFVISRNFTIQRFGDKQWLINQYNFDKITESIDEIIILNISRENFNYNEFLDNVKFISKKCFIPISVGGNIDSYDRAESIFKSGGDKIVLNSSLFEKPELVNQISKNYGSQSIIASIDVKKINNQYEVFIRNGSKNVGKFEEYIKYVNNLHIGEIIINSIDKDGTGNGYDLDIFDSNLFKNINKPIILSGGAGKDVHFKNGLNIDFVDAVSTSHLFNFIGDGLINVRKFLLKNNFNLAIR